MDTIPLNHGKPEVGGSDPDNSASSPHDTAPSGNEAAVSIAGSIPPSESRYTKLPGLVVVRAAAALGVVLLHVCVPYAQNPMPGLVWPIRDATHFAIDCVFWGIEVVVMPVFLFIAGFLVWRSLQRGGPGKLVRSRARRLLIPFAFAVLVILPVEPFIWVLGFVTEGLVPIVKLKSLKLEGELAEDFWGLSHLWFLPYLFLYVAVVALGARLVGQYHGLRCGLSSLMRNPFLVPAVLIGVAATILVSRPEVVWGFQHAFLPIPSKWLYCLCFFLGGLRLGARDWELSDLAFHARRLIPVAVLLMATAVILGRWHLSFTPRDDSSYAVANYTLAVLTASGAWFITMAAMSAAVLIGDRVPRAVEYVAGASFWIYLFHHPILGLVHIDLKWLLPGTSPLIKATISFVLVIALCLATYEMFMCRTRLGAWLGLAEPRRPTSVDDPEITRMPSSGDEHEETRRAA